MSKAKNVLCLVLALVMVFALAVPAFAAGGDDEGIEPYGQWVKCPRCGADAAYSKYTTTEQVSVSTCPNFGHTHAHRVITTTYAYDCTGCGYWEKHDYSTVCPYA